MPALLGTRRRRTAADVEHSVDAIRRLLRHLRVAARRSELATGLSPAQAFVLSCIRDAPGCSLNDIAAATMTDRTSSSSMVDRLLEHGFVTRGRAAEDGRRAVIAITARGRKALDAAPPAPTQLLVEGLEGLSAARLRQLSQGLTALTESMGIDAEPVVMLFEDLREQPRARRRPGGKRSDG